MKKNIVIVMVGAFLAGGSLVQAQEMKNDSYAKAQLEKMKEFKKHRLSSK